MSEHVIASIGSPKLAACPCCGLEGAMFEMETRATVDPVDLRDAWYVFCPCGLRTVSCAEAADRDAHSAMKAAAVIWNQRPEPA